MKQRLTINKKWVLTASLIAVLVSHYSYQNSSLNLMTKNKFASQNSGEYILASRKPAQTTSGDNTTAKTNQNETIIPTPTKSSENTESSANIEGGCTSGDCNKQVMTISTKDWTALLTRIEALEKKPTTTKTTPTTTQEAEYDCDPVTAEPTAKEKREHAKCIKDAKKQAKEDAKKEKEEERLDKNKEKFEEAVERLNDKCDKDVECLASGFSSILSRFTGKNALPAGVVNTEFNKTVVVELNKSLYSDDPAKMEGALATLQSLMQGMPEQYVALKKTVMTAVKNQATIAAKAVTTNISQANAFASQNKPQEYFEALQKAQESSQKFMYLTNSYGSSMSESLQTVGDMTTLEYFQKSYLPDMQKIANSLTVTVQEDKLNTNNTRDTRNGQTVNTSGTNQNSVTTTVNQQGVVTNQTVDNKMTRDGNNFVMQPNSNNGGLTIGTPTTTGNPNGRRPR